MLQARRLNLKMLTALLIGVVVAGPANASQIASQFYHGTWNCMLDGRPTTIVWRVVDDTRTTCNGDTCSVTHGVKTVGSFLDRGTWVSLTMLGASSQSITFRHPDGNNWYLYNAGTRRMNGHSVWQGNQYPLSCSR